MLASLLYLHINFNKKKGYKMMFKKSVLLLIVLLSVLACQKQDEKASENEVAFNGHKVTVNEVIQGKTYTYLLVTENDVENWIAIAKRETKEDEVLYYTDALEMQNFESKELARTFEKIQFVSNVSNTPTQEEVKMGNKQSTEKVQIDEPIAAPKDGISIATLYEKRDSYKDKVVILKGKVTKVNNQIMNRNWIHIQDGSSSDKTVDLTVTTNDEVKLGDVVVVKGTITLSKDFGAGYFYDVIMESATVSTEKTM